MEPRDYLVAVCRRAAWVAVLAVLGAGIGALVAALNPVSYTSTTSLYAGIDQVSTADDTNAAGHVTQRLLPSIVQLARSSAVLTPVIAELHLSTTVPELSRSISVTSDQTTSVIQITAGAPKPDQAVQLTTAVGQQLALAAPAAYPGGSGQPGLRLSTVQGASSPHATTERHIPIGAGSGLVLGLVAACLLACLAALLHPRISSVSDAARLTNARVLPAYRGSKGADGRRRADSVERLWWLLNQASATAGHRRVALVGVDAGLAEELRAVGSTVGTDIAGEGEPPIVLLPVPDTRRLRNGTTSVDAAVIVARSGRTGRRTLSATLAQVRASQVPVAGVVVDGVVPSDASWRARLGAALRGNAVLGPLERWAGERGRARGSRPGVSAASGQLTAVVALAALGLDWPLPLATTTGLFAVALLLPIWAGSLRRYRGAVALTLLMLAAVVCGLLLTVWSSSAHSVDSRNVVATTFLLLTAAGGLGLFLWARTVLPLSTVTLAFGVGLLVRGVLGAPGSPNVWKFELALPVTIVVLSLLSRRRHTIASVVALAALGAVSLLYDARSGFGFCAIAALLVLWQARPTSRSPHQLRWTGVLALAAAGLAAYFAISGLLVSGTLGSTLQQKTTQQISEGGSLLLGGRPEWTATLALMQQSPLGFGLGVVPNPGDVLTAKTGISVAHIPTASGYVEHYLLGSGFELHSIFSDLWAAVGPIGLVLGLVMGLFIIRDLATLITRRRASALACFFGVASLWYLPFGPLPSNFNDVIFTLGILLPLRAAVGPARRAMRATPARAVPAGAAAPATDAQAVPVPVAVTEPANGPFPVG